MTTDNLYASDYGKRICLACGGRLGENLSHLEPPAATAARRFNESGMQLPPATGNALDEFDYARSAQG